MKTFFVSMLLTFSFAAHAQGPTPLCASTAMDAAWKFASQKFPLAQLQSVGLELGASASQSLVNWHVTVEEAFTGAQRDYEVLVQPTTCQILNASEINSVASLDTQGDFPSESDIRRCQGFTGCEYVRCLHNDHRVCK